jgi:hypothetical protein
MKQHIIQGPGTYAIPLQNSAFVPFCNYAGWSNTYFQHGTFDFDILNSSGGTIGSPAVFSGFTLGGFLTSAGGRVSSDGKTITFHIPDGQKLLVAESDSEAQLWEVYNRSMEADAPAAVPGQPHWLLPEYCTWVEQKAIALDRRTGPRQVLNEGMVVEFMSRVKALGLPLGKLTIDDGWQQTLSDSSWTDGYWRVDTDKFPDLPRLCRRIAEEGFTPGLWFGIPCVPVDAPIVRERPELFADQVENSETETAVQSRRYFRPSEELTDFYREIVRSYIEMGFRKFKFDFFYGPIGLMRGIMRCLHDAVRSVDPTVEIESHHPDFFFSRWLDVCRLNDVLIRPGFDWVGTTLAHMRVTERSAPDRIMNLDHVGGNEPVVSEEDYIRHVRLFDLSPEIPRYPVVSLLPDRFTERAVNEIKRYLTNHSPRDEDLPS